MKLSAPIFVLKAQAKELKRTRSITNIEALDLIARREGFSSWSLLQSQTQKLQPRTQAEILEYLNPGDLMLVASRPGLGKTTFTLSLLVQASKEGRQSFFFTLESNRRDIAQKISTIDESLGENCSNLTFDFSDEISSKYIIQKTKSLIRPGDLIGIDYLQLLDQKRSNPELQTQVEELQIFAKEQKCILIFISQVERTFDSGPTKYPDLSHIRLPNPLDLKLFNKSLFLQAGKKTFVTPAQFEIL